MIELSHLNHRRDILFDFQEEKNSYLCGKFCGCGGIGRRVRLRIWCLRAWGFESLHPHY